MTTEALGWVTRLLAENKVPYLICGGFAAFVYGAKRSINDIDLFVPEENFDHVVDLGREYVTKPAQQYFEEAEGWHVKYVQFKYADTKIEVGSAQDVEIFDSSIRQWVDLRIDFSKAEYRSVYGIDVSLMAKEDLIRYKKVLARPVDLYDVEAMGFSE